MNELYEFLQQFTGYRDIIRLLIIFVIVSIVAVLVSVALSHLKRQMDADRQEKLRDDNLKNIDYETFGRKEKASILRKMIASDAIDTGPNKYMVISDGGNEVYVRTFTVSKIPNKVRFANTFSALMNFKDCESSIFVKPVAEDETLNEMNKYINNLESEDYSAAKRSNNNRRRLLRGELRDANAFAEQVEAGDTKFYSVGFLFTLHAESVKELNKATQEFYNTAKKKGIDITNCYTYQPEAFALNGPWNGNIKVSTSNVPFKEVPYYSFDKKSISTLFNYTQVSFSHKDGAILGLDMFNAAPIVYDPFDGSHDGYTILVAGKVGTGKSAMVKMLASRLGIQGMHFACIDSKQRKGTSEGEYAATAALLNGVNFQISNQSDDIMNIFDISETTRNVKDANGTLHEVRTLELSDKITMLSNIILKLVAGSYEKSEISLKDNTYINDVITSNLSHLYRSRGFVDGDPDSLYTTPGSVNAQRDNSTLRNGKALKIMPTMHDYFLQILISARDNTEDTLREAYNVVKLALKNYVKEMYYSEDTCVEFDRETYLSLKYNESIQGREFINVNKRSEKVVEVHGIRAYFDGQSSVHIDRDCPFTNIDISLLPDAEKELTRQVALEYINENFIKKNSLSLSSDNRLMVILDEAHEMYKNLFDRITVDAVVRTARSRNVSMMLISQTLKEYDNYPETQAILKQAATKFVLKQDPSDRQYLIDTVALTEAQASMIVDIIGGNPDDESDQNKHRGEVCIIDNKSVAFCKVAYREKTEALAVATDAKGIAKAFGQLSA